MADPRDLHIETGNMHGAIPADKDQRVLTRRISAGYRPGEDSPVVNDPSGILKAPATPKTPDGMKRTLSFHVQVKKHDGDDEETYGTLPVSQNYSADTEDVSGPPRGCCLVM